MSLSKTEYLYGVKPEKYAKLQIELATMKIADARVLLKELKPKLNLLDHSIEGLAIAERVTECNVAIVYNQKLLDEVK